MRQPHGSKESLRLREALGDIPGSVKTLNELGTAFRTQIRWDPAIQCYLSAQELAEEFGEDKLSEELAYASMYIGVIYTGLGRYEDALSAYNRSERIYKQTGDQYGQARVTQRYGWLARIQGRFDDALSYHDAALVSFRKLGFAHSLAECLHSKGTVHRVRKEFVLALEHYNEALSIFQKLNANRHIGLMLHELGALHEAMGQYEAAIEYFSQSLEMKLAAGQEREASTTLNYLGDIYAELGQWQEAESHLMRSVQIARDIDCAINVVSALASLCDLNYRRGDFERIHVFAQEAIEIGVRDGYNPYVSKVYRIYALVYYEQYFIQDAARALAKSIFFALQYNEPFMIDLLKQFRTVMEKPDDNSLATTFLDETLADLQRLDLHPDSLLMIELHVKHILGGIR